MLIHDTYIYQVKEILKDLGKEVKVLDNIPLELKKNSDYILDSETKLELGSTNNSSTSTTFCTCEESFEDKIIVIGDDIPFLEGKVTNYAKMVFVSLKKNDDESSVYKSIKNISRGSLGLNFPGTMFRATLSKGYECFRISYETHKKGLNFSIIGSALLQKLKGYDDVLNVQIYYIVQNDLIIDKLKPYNEKVGIITNAMNHIFENLDLDCGSCLIKEVCDEVEGMREEHKKQLKDS